MMRACNTNNVYNLKIYLNKAYVIDISFIGHFRTRMIKVCNIFSFSEHARY